MDDKPIIVAVDVPTEYAADSLLDKLDPNKCRVKVGNQLFLATGKDFVKKIINRGFDVFFDQKYHDIPNTVGETMKIVAGLGVWMTNIHTSGGPGMMQAARSAVDSCGSKMLLIGVTVLTSLDQHDLQKIGCTGTPKENVLRLATLAEDCGLDGVVCSPQEVVALRDTLGKDSKLVTPGIRFENGEAGDQKRITSPRQAGKWGSDYLVMGRPIREADNLIVALDRANREYKIGVSEYE